MLIHQQTTSTLINLIINQYFQNYYCLLIFQDISRGVNYSGPIPQVKLTIANKTIDYGLVFRKHGCHGIVIHASYPSEILNDFETHLRLQQERFNDRRYFIIVDNLSNFQKIFELEILFYIIDLLVVTTDDVGLSFYTHSYIGLDSYNKIVLLDKWFQNNQSFLFGKDLFPDKFSNQFGRPFRVSTITYAPYSIPIHDNDTFLDFYGSELSIAMFFAREYNMTAIPVIKEDEYWGELYENYTGTGVMGNVLKDEADVCFASLGSWEVTDSYLDYSVPTIRTGVTSLVPSPKLADFWLTPLYSYDKDLWAAVALLLFIITFLLSSTLYFYNHNDLMREKYDVKNSSTLLNSFCSSTGIIYKIFMVQSLEEFEIPTELVTKFIMILLLTFSVFFSSTYSSGFASIMTIPRYKNPIDTVKDLADSRLFWGATGDAWILSIVEAEEPEFRAIVEHFVVASEDELEKQAKTRKFGFAMERLPYRRFAVGDYVSKDVINDYHVMANDIYYTQCPMMTRKSSVILPYIDKFILKTFETGLIEKWQDLAVDKFLDSYVQRAVKFPFKHNTVVKLAWKHVQGAFAVLIIGCCISIIVFVIELLVHRNKTTNFSSQIS